MLLAQRVPELFVPILLEAAQDAQGEIRVTACRSLVNAQTEPRVVIPILIAAAKDQQDEVRIEAASDLARVGNPIGSSQRRTARPGNASLSSSAPASLTRVPLRSRERSLARPFRCASPASVT